MLIVCTDHGHYLGEEREGRDIWGKPGVPQYEPLGHTPLLVTWPGQPGGQVCDALTTNVDIFATVADIFDAEVVSAHPRTVDGSPAHRGGRRHQGLGPRGCVRAGGCR